MNTDQKFKILGMIHKVGADIMANDFPSASNLAAIVSDICAGQALDDGPYVAQAEALKALHETRDYQLDEAADEAGIIDPRDLQEKR